MRIIRIIEKHFSLILFILLVVLCVLFVIRAFILLIIHLLAYLHIINRAKRIKKRRNTRDVATILNEKLVVKKAEESIVGFAKPVGFWSSLLLGGKITEVFDKAKNASLKDDSKSFWASVAEAQAKENAKNKKG
ncbi:MAG: hypothetical protein LBT02_04190 [Rickettsiales bacterium]|jgi:hypothetical protein|nr:hypothetical protein [Rickettsiales bacterium]